MYEIGKVIQAEKPGVRTQPNNGELLPRQDLQLGLCYAKKDENIPYYFLMQTARDLLNAYCSEFELRSGTADSDYLHPGRSAGIYINGLLVGVAGEIHPSVQKKLGLDYRVAVCELNLEKMAEENCLRDKNFYKSVPEYPATLRDIALLMEKDIVYDDLKKAIENFDELIDQVQLFDVYENEKVGKNKKSMAFHINYSSEKGTLASAEVDKIHKNLEKFLQKEFGAEIRKYN